MSLTFIIYIHNLWHVSHKLYLIAVIQRSTALYTGACAGYGCTSGATSTTFGWGSTIGQFRFHREIASCEHSVADATSRSCVREKKYIETQHLFWSFLVDNYIHLITPIYMYIYILYTHDQVCDRSLGMFPRLISVSLKQQLTASFFDLSCSQATFLNTCQSFQWRSR